MFKVMLVDDEPLVLSELKALISWEEYGFTLCGEARNSEDALELIREHSPELVITDMKMPEVDGLGLIRAVRKEIGDKTRFIVLSGYDDYKYSKMAVQYSVKDYILKPVDKDELTEVLKTIYKDLQEDKDKERNIYIKAIANNTIRQLITGKVDEVIVNRGNNVLGTFNDKEIRCLLVVTDFDFRGNYSNGQDMEMMITTVRRSILSVIGSKNELNIYEDEANQYVVITNEAILAGYDNNPQLLAKEIQGAVSDGCRVNVSVFVGEKVEEIGSISQSYTEALASMKHKFYREAGCIVFYNEIKDIAFDCSFNPGNSISNLVEAIGINKKDIIKSSIQNLFNEFRDGIIEPDIVKVYMNNLRLQVIELITEMEGNVDEFLRSYPFLAYDIKRFTLDLLMENMEEFCCYSAEYISGLRKEQSQRVIYEVENYLRKNYYEELSLNMLADKFHVNQVYLGQLFKNTFGMHFVDFLHNLRIEEAKKLIKRTDMKVSEVARIIGYNDPDYFIGNFERIVNMTPTQYKRQME